MRSRVARALLCGVLALVACEARADAAAPPVRASTAQPNVHVLAPMPMPGLDRERAVRVYLPPGYETSHSRYPVLYLHDGQNLFDDATSFLGEWQVDESLNRLARDRRIELIVVGVDNGGDLRLQELAPLENAKGVKPEGDAYLAFIVKVVKPWIDAHYRTKPGRADTAIGGSSLGALISHYALYRYPQTFGKALLFSPSYWYTPGIFGYTGIRRLPPATKIYFYAGDAEDEHMLPDLQRMLGVLGAAKFPADDRVVHVVTGAHHNEDAWRREFPAAVEWLFSGSTSLTDAGRQKRLRGEKPENTGKGKSI